MSPIVAYPVLLFSFSALSYCPVRTGSIINFARAFAAAMTLVRTNDEQHEHAFHSLTAVRNEYNKALPTVAAARGRIFAHAHETTVDDLSQPKGYESPDVCNGFCYGKFLSRTNTIQLRLRGVFIGKNWVS